MALLRHPNRYYFNELSSSKFSFLRFAEMKVYSPLDTHHFPTKTVRGKKKKWAASELKVDQHFRLCRKLGDHSLCKDKFSTFLDSLHDDTLLMGEGTKNCTIHRELFRLSADSLEAHEMLFATQKHDGELKLIRVSMNEPHTSEFNAGVNNFKVCYFPFVCVERSLKELWWQRSEKSLAVWVKCLRQSVQVSMVSLLASAEL